MDKIQLTIFLKRYANDKHTTLQHEAFIEWTKNASIAEIENAMALYLQYEDQNQVFHSPSPAFINGLESRLDELDQRPALSGTRLWYSIAAAVAMMALCLFFFTRPNAIQSQVSLVNGIDIQPGKHQAVLTLANGSKIALEGLRKGKFASEAGVVLEKPEDGQISYKIKNNAASTKEKLLSYNTVTTPKGGLYQVILPDGTKVWLNAASSLKYPVQFATQERRVTLTGEAYFEVSKRKAQPFIVSTDQQTVKVLGTHFNINSYSDNRQTSTTLLEGRVSVSALARPSIAKILEPGQQAQLKGTEITLAKANTEAVMAWKKSLFSFDDADLKTIMIEFSRWYDVPVFFEGTMPDQRFTGEISKNSKASEFLEILSSFKVKFRIEGNDKNKTLSRIIVSTK
jgi:transmembrane sensor